jgi:hypothetical protein
MCEYFYENVTVSLTLTHGVGVSFYGLGQLAFNFCFLKF